MTWYSLNDFYFEKTWKIPISNFRSFCNLSSKYISKHSKFRRKNADTSLTTYIYIFRIVCCTARLLQAEAMEALLYRPLGLVDNDTLPTAPTGYRVPPPAWNLPAALVRSGSQTRVCQCVEAMVRQRRLHFAGGWRDSRRVDFRSE